MNNSNQPQKYDAILGGQAPPPINSVVLGGIKGVEKRLVTGLQKHQIAALNDALNYGEAGLNIILKSLQTTTGKVKLLAYYHLSNRSETWIQEALKEYSPYEFLQCVETFKVKANHVVLSLDNEILVYATDSLNYIKLKNRDSRPDKRVRSFHWSHFGKINTFVISPDGQRIISAGSDGYIAVWNFSTCKLIKKFKAHSNSVNAIVINPDAGNFISAGAEGVIKIWDLHSCKELGILYLKGYSKQTVCALCIVPGGKLLISGNNETIRVWDLHTKRDIWKLEGHSHDVKSLAISPDGKTLVSGSDQRIKVWDIQLGQEIFSFYGHADWIRSIVFSPNGRSFISAGDVSIKVWDVLTGKKINSFREHNDAITSLALSYDGAMLVSSSCDGTIKVWRY